MTPLDQAIEDVQLALSVVMQAAAVLVSINVHLMLVASSPFSYVPLYPQR